MLSIKTAIAVIGLSVSGLATAAMYTPPVTTCSGINATTPCQSQWEFGVQALYVQSSPLQDITTTGYGAPILDAPPVANITHDSTSLTLPWDWGYRLEGGYHFGSGKDINLNWTTLHQSANLYQNNSQQGLIPSFIPLSPPGASSNLPAIFENVNTSVDDDFDAVNLEFGQRAFFGNHINLRFHAGLQFAQIRQNITQDAWFVEPYPLFQHNSTSRFRGVGPRAGIDGEYTLYHGVSLVADAAASVLFGRTNFNYTDNVLVPVNGVEEIATQHTNNTARQGAVPSLEAKLGAKYTHPLYKGNLNIEGGYQIVNYWNVINNVDFTNIDDSNTNYGFHGAYIGLSWLGNI